MPASLTISKLIHAPPVRVWRMITDTRIWPEWGPSIRAVESSSRYIAEGTTGRVQTSIGLWLPFTVNVFEPGVRWDWTVAGIAATGHRVQPAGPDRCRLMFSVPIWAAPYCFVCHLALVRIARLLRSPGRENAVCRHQ